MKLIALVSEPSCAAKKMEPINVDIVLAVLALVFVVGLIFYIRALVNAANSDRWGWVILMLVLWPMFLFYRSRPREDRYKFLERREPTSGEDQTGR